MYKYAGVTLDFYDDKGRTLRDKFPTQEDLPDVIKTAEIYPSESIPDDAFALIAVDGDHVLKKYACHDPGTTAMSVIYFMEHGDKLPEDAQKVAAANLVDACVEHGILPPVGLTKIAISGPLLELAGLGTPSAIGYMVGKGHGAEAARQGEAAPEASLGDIVGYTLMPGYTGYELGRRSGYKGALKKKASLRGAAAGGAIGGGMGLYSGRKEDLKENLKQALIGAAGGAVVGGVGTRAAKAAGKGIRGEVTKGIGEATRKAHEGIKPIAKELEVAAAKSARGARKGLLGLRKIESAPLATLSKTSMAKGAEVIDITGQLPKAKYASAPTSNVDYAVTSEGRQLYPIDTWDNVKLASEYWDQHRRIMEPEMRREFAVKVAAKADQLGIYVSEDLQEAGSTKYASTGHLKNALDMRKCAFDMASEDAEFLEDLFEKHASMRPEVYSEVLHRFDKMHSLTAGWDNVFLDPWSSTYGIDKTATVVWEAGADRVTTDELDNLARNHSGSLGEIFSSEDMIKGFEKDPEGVFNGLPEPHKKIMARLAADMSSKGGSETAKEAV